MFIHFCTCLCQVDPWKICWVKRTFIGSFLVAQWVKNPALLQLWLQLHHRFDPWLRNFYMLRAQPKKKEEKKTFIFLINVAELLYRELRPGDSPHLRWQLAVLFASNDAKYSSSSLCQSDKQTVHTSLTCEAKLFLMCLFIIYVLLWGFFSSM